jgi:hypothetical protein
MTMGLLCAVAMTDAMGSAVYGTPHRTSNGVERTLAHMLSATD